MDSLNTSIWAINSTVPPSVLNESSDIAKKYPSLDVHYPIVVFLSAIILGLPGNVLVIAIYIAKMTTSTRVYMFGLAVADMAICISSIVLTLDLTHLVAVVIFLYYIIGMAIKFSMFLLVFVSIERLIAVTRPHTFTMNPKRAKIYLLVFLLCTVLFTLENAFSFYMNYAMFDVILKTGFLTASALIIVICYTLIGITLLKKALDSRHRVTGINVQLSNQSSYPSNPTLFRATVPSGVAQSSATVPSGVAQSSATVPSGVAQSSATVPSGVAQSSATVPSGVAQSSATVPSGVAQSSATVPSGVAQSSATVPSGVAQSSATVPSGVAQSSATVPSGVAQSSATVPSGVANSGPATKLTYKEVKNIKSMFLLFIITVVFVVFWMPMWLSNTGVSVSKHVTRVYVINSVVNPFIYGVASAMFREDVIQFYRQKRAKLSGCYN